MITDWKGGIVGGYIPKFAASYKVTVSLMYFSHVKAVAVVAPYSKGFPDVSE
jgi:hypothetical protein